MTAFAGRVYAAQPPKGDYIVVLKDHAGDPGAVASKHAKKHGGQVGYVYKHALKGYSATLSTEAASALKRDPAVQFVSEAREFQATEQFLPRGVDRIDGDVSSAASGDGSGSVDIDIAVIDSGIDFNHPDLNVVGGIKCVKDKKPGFGDVNGHGTSVAGIVAARDNTDLGFVGVAPGARLWSVRVLDKKATGKDAEIICGIDFVTASRTDADPSNDIEVASVSIGGRGSDDGNCGLTNRDPVHLAICRSVAAGVTYVVSAGNEHDDMAKYTPASYQEVLTATAITDFDGQPGGLTDQSASPSECILGLERGYADDTVAGVFSNFATLAADRVHTVAAPGVCVQTTHLTSETGFATATGTSFAAPHISGVVALCIASGDCAGLTPAQIIQKIVSDAAAYNNAHPEYGFRGDPLRPIPGKYYGYLIRAAQY
jgi:subtilisin family serine protease